MEEIKNKDYSVLPFITFSKENLLLLLDSCEKEEIGMLMEDLIRYIYFNADKPNYEKKYLNGVFSQLLMVIIRKGEGYFKQKEAGKKGAEIRYSKLNYKEEEEKIMLRDKARFNK